MIKKLREAIKYRLEKPTSKELKNFGILFGTFVILLFGIMFPYFFNYKHPFWPFIIFILFLLVSITLPKKLRYFYYFWIFIGNILAWINTRVILGLVFYIIFLPTGLVIRLLRKDLLGRKIKKNDKSYRLPSRIRDIKHFEKPF
tara:strand:- start:12566 stop:12997 length:432 start_codon:yes stop_codon:yes gene_type:complete